MPLDMPLLPNAQAGMKAVTAQQCKPDLALTPRRPAFQWPGPDSGLLLTVELNRMDCLILAGQLWCTAHLSCRIPQVTAAAYLDAQADGGHSYPLPETGPQCLRLLDPC